MIGEKKLRVLLLVCGCLVVVLGLAALGLAFLYGYLPPADRAAQVVHLRDAQQIDEEGFLVLVNETHPLPDDYEPEDLVNLAEARPKNTIGLKDISMRANKTAFAALCDLAADMKAEGYEGLTVIASYRDLEKQQELFRASFNGRDIFGKPYVQTPEATEHRTGLAFDLSVLDEDGQTLVFSETPHYTYVLEHMADYGFILRYPSDKQEITGIGYEPWHIRYVGKEAAVQMQAEGLCLEEYVQRLEDAGQSS